MQISRLISAACTRPRVSSPLLQVKATWAVCTSGCCEQCCCGHCCITAFPKAASRPGAPTPRAQACALEAAQGAPRDSRRDSRGERSPWLPLEPRPDSPWEPGKQRRPAAGKRPPLSHTPGTGPSPPSPSVRTSEWALPQETCSTRVSWGLSSGSGTGEGSSTYSYPLAETRMRRRTQLGPRPTWRSVWVRISTKCQGL